MAPWSEAGYPASLNDCLALSSCAVHSDGSCICDVDTSEQQVFAAASEIGSSSNLMSALHTGAVDPDTFDSGTYIAMGDCGISGVSVYSTSGDCESLGSATIFALEEKSKQYFLKNVHSMVHIVGTSHAFRNPVQFNR